jgi:hypothetical protein
VKRALVTALLATGCGHHPGATNDPDGGDTTDSGMQEDFVALVGDFEGWPQWEHYDLGYEPPDVVHLGGDRTVFLNKKPPHGATAFPNGTIIVKQVIPDDGGTPQVFGMSKRGDDFNIHGAIGWEWLELAYDTDPPVIVWRGVSPPSNTGYGTIPNGACNHCHTGGVSNDYVMDQPLTLTNF